MKTIRIVLAVITLLFGIFIIYTSPFYNGSKTSCVDFPQAVVHCSQPSKIPYDLIVGAYLIATSILLLKKPKIGWWFFAAVDVVLIFVFVSFLNYKFFNKLTIGEIHINSPSNK
jgi:hypothetical protein